MRKKKLTKWSLFWRCGREFSTGWLLIATVAMVLGVFIGIIHHTGACTILFAEGGMILSFLLLLLVLLLYGQGKGFLLLRRQERLFGFRFADEGLNPDFPDERWFLTTDCYLLAFRRGFIRKTGKIRKLYYGRNLCVMSILDCERRKHRIRGFEEDLLALKRWVAAGETQ
jgi:hypothetical protein